jgi:hypothetical protein
VGAERVAPVRASTSFVDPGHTEQVPALIGLLLTVEGPFAWGQQPPGEDLGALRLKRYSDDRMPLPHLSLEAVDGDGPAAVFERHESMTIGAVFSVKALLVKDSRRAVGTTAHRLRERALTSLRPSCGAAACADSLGTYSGVARRIEGEAITFDSHVDGAQAVAQAIRHIAQRTDTRMAQLRHQQSLERRPSGSGPSISPRS